ncbi:MAG: surface-adhesin E family protein [Limnohabitans sp.]|jgi:hypothetical protein
MKRFLCFLVLTFVGASHAMWITVTRNEIATVYLDSASIIRSGSNRRVWVVYDLAKPDTAGQQSVKSNFEYDCGESKYKTLSSTSHPNKMGNGPVLKSIEVPAEWRTVSQDNLSRQLFAFACAW